VARGRQHGPAAVAVLDVGRVRLQHQGTTVGVDEGVALSALGLSGILCAGPVDHHARMNLSSNMMANWVFASPHSRGDIFHSVAV
jgi:hypothetical protein